MTRTVFLQTNGTEWKKSASLTGKQWSSQYKWKPSAREQKHVVQGKKQFPRHVDKNLVLQICGEPEDSCHGFSFFTQAEKGIKLVEKGQYAQAVALFTEAIKCDPEDYRYVN